MVRTGILKEIQVADYEGWVAGAHWLRASDDSGIYFFSIHSPTANENERRSSYVEESVRLVGAISELVPSNAKLVIGGDFNFKSLGERLESEQLKTDTAELRALQTFRNCGFSIAWRDLYPERALPQTLRWRRDPTPAFHCDGFLTRGCASSGMACDIVTADSEIRFSDHNPVLLQMPNDRI